MKRALAILMVLAIAVSAQGCDTVSQASPAAEPIKSYRDIPGVTAEEIAAIEALKAERGVFSYGGTLSTEAFRMEDGTSAGFMYKFCDLLTALFGAEFVPETYEEWSELKDDFDRCSVDFVGELTRTPQRAQVYYMTHAIADRSLRAFTLADSAGIESKADIEGRRIGFLRDTITSQYISKYYSVSFETVDVDNYPDAAEKLRSGEVDLFILDAIADIVFADYDFIRSQEVFPLVYYPVSMTTANRDLAPIISVVNKYLSSGGTDKLYELYQEGELEYARYRLDKSFTAEERAYLDNLAKWDSKVHVGLEHDNYPISFYNEKDGEFQGIAIDVMEEICSLTGIRFESLTTRDATWASILEKLQTGEVSMVSQLLYSDARKDHFIWSTVPYSTSYYALISKAEHPYISYNQIAHESVGVVRGTAMEDMYNQWFPDVGNITLYDTHYESLTALEKGEVDLLMASEHILLTQINYLEKPEYKIIIPFDAPMNSFFGFNKDEVILRSIIDKAQPYVKTDNIERDWTNRTYDYAKNLADLRTAYLLVFIVILSGVLILLIRALWVNKRLSEERREMERQEAEARHAALVAEESSRMKSVFLANMSHEIRTPMNSIIGFSDLALGCGPSPEIRSFLQKIRNSSEILLNIINDILDISKIEAGRIKLEQIPFNMHDVFAVCQTVIEPRATEKGVMLYCYAEPSVGKKLLGDPTRLRQALLNLLSNAVKFTGTGMVKLLSAIEKSDENSVTIRFEVKDSGIGMSEEEMEKIFEPFMQADDSTTRRYGGTGLGLTITKNVIELMGGELMVESTPGVGSKFSFVLTFQTVDAPADAPKSKTPYMAEKPVYKGEVLVCEDNLMNQEVICEQLSRVGLDYVVAGNGKECVDIVRSRMTKGEKPFGLIFMDIHMPVMDGLDAANELTRIGNQSPVVALTANIMPDDRETYRKHNMPDYLAKPFKTEELWDCLNRYFIPCRFISAISEGSAAEERMNQRLLSNFANDNQTTFRDITAAIKAGDTKLAHRLAHTLKGVAGLIGEAGLQKAAHAVERSLDGGKAEVAPERLAALGRELDAVLGKLAHLLDKPSPRAPDAEVLDKREALALLDRVDILLWENNSDCLDLVEMLRDIPGTETLITQIDHYDFKPARETLDMIRRDLSREE